MNQPFPEEAFSLLAAEEGKHWWFTARNNIILWVLSSKATRIKDFIEVGCGTGFVINGISKKFPTWNLEGSEYFENGLAFARRRVPRCSFKRLNAINMNDISCYDCIGTFDVLEHIKPDTVVLKNFYRALRPNGYLLLTVPQHRYLWSAADQYAHHVRRYNYKNLKSKVLSAGFKIEYSTSFVSLLLPLMFFQRVVSSKKKYNPSTELKTNVLLNSFLYFIMRLEYFLMLIGITFSIGGSRLILARKS